MMDGELPLAAHWLWLILAVVLAAAEIALPGVFLIWIAVAAALTGLLTLATGIGGTLQLLIFAAFSLASAWGGRRWVVSRPRASADPLLNDRAARMVGHMAEVIDPIRHGRGRVKVGDSVWPATGPDLDAGTVTRIAAVEDGTVRVEPLAP